MGFFKKIFSKEKKEKLDEGLEKSKSNFFGKLSKAVAGKSKVDESVLDDLEEVLVSSDVGVATTIKIIDRIEARVARDKYMGTEELNTILREEIAALLSESEHGNMESLEIPEGNGYARKAVTLNNATMVGSQSTAVSQEFDWTATGGTIPEFTHVCFITNGSTTHGSTTGVINRVEPVSNGNATSLNDGEKYIYSFQVSVIASYNS